MDPEYAKKIDRLLELAEENNAHIKDVRRSQKTSQMIKAIYWVIGIAIAASAYYAVKPYLNTLASAYGAVAGTSSSTAIAVPSAAELQKLYAQYVSQATPK